MHSRLTMTFPSFNFTTFTYSSHPHHSLLHFTSLHFTAFNGAWSNCKTCKNSRRGRLAQGSEFNQILTFGKSFCLRYLL
jgi:hypothetical protein